MNAGHGKVTPPLSQEHDSLAFILARWLRRKDLVAAQAADFFGISHQTIYNWLDGHLPPATRIPALARALGVSEKKLRQVIERQRAQHASKASPAVRS